jgi:hypothetical protein
MTNIRENQSQRLRIASGVAFSASKGAALETTVSGRHVKLGDYSLRVALEFSAPRDPAEVFASGRVGTNDAAFFVAVDEVVQLGVVERLGSESLPAPVNKTILDLLNPLTFRKRGSLERLGKAVAEGRAIIVRNAFRTDVAEKVYEALASSRQWAPWTYLNQERPYLQYRLNGISASELPIAAREVGVILSSPGSKAILSQLTGCDCSGPFRIGAALYNPGDYSSVHNDNGGARCLSYIWYLAKNWQPDWGGHFVWCPTGAVVDPGFNTLALFKVTKASLHLVSPVTPHARGKRVSLNGWWDRGAPGAPDQPSAVKMAGVRLCPGAYGEPSEIIDPRGIVAL